MPLAMTTMYEEADRGWLDLDLIRILATSTMAPRAVKPLEDYEQFDQLRQN